MTRHLSTREEKVKWLRNHPEVWKLPHSEIKNRMVEAKLVSPKTYIADIRLSLLLSILKMKG